MSSCRWRLSTRIIRRNRVVSLWRWKLRVRLQLQRDPLRGGNVAARPRAAGLCVVHVPSDWARRSQRGDPLPVVVYTNEAISRGIEFACH
jgi:hypothetical protein